MLISVIIPVYNVEKYLKTCIDSVLTQDFKDYEIILVNDGSTDNSPIICDEYAEKYDCVSVIHQKNKGLGGARNTGIDAARGEYLLFLDSDDFILPEAFSYLTNIMAGNNPDIVCFGRKNVLENGETDSFCYVWDSGEKVLSAKDYFMNYINNPFATNKLFKTNLFKDNGIYFPDRRWYEDLETIPKVILYAKDVLITHKVLYGYLLRQDSIMHVKNADRNIEMLEAVEDVLDYYKKQQCFEEYYSELEYLCILHVLVLVTTRVASIDSKHKLLTEFYDFVKCNFPDFHKNSYLKEYLPRRRKLIYELSRRKMYKSLFLLNKLNNLR